MYVKIQIERSIIKMTVYILTILTSDNHTEEIVVFFMN